MLLRAGARFSTMVSSWVVQWALLDCNFNTGNVSGRVEVFDEHKFNGRRGDWGGLQEGKKCEVLSASRFLEGLALLMESRTDAFSVR